MRLAGYRCPHDSCKLIVFVPSVPARLKSLDSTIEHCNEQYLSVVQDDAFEAVYKARFIEFLAAVPPWFTLDINQGVLTLHLAESQPSAFDAEVYGAALGQAVADDFKYNFGHHVLHSVLAVLRAKATNRADVDVRARYITPQWRATSRFRLHAHVRDCSTARGIPK